MQLHLALRRIESTETLQRELERHVERLQKRLRHFSPDLVKLDLTIERHPRKREHSGSIRLTLPSRVLPARRNRAATVEGLLKAAFDDLEEQVARHMAQLRREHAHGRKRASLPPEVVEARERELLEERELLDRALNGDSGAFDQLIAQELGVLEREIERAIRSQGREPSEGAVQHVLGDVLAIAFRELRRKPARWSMVGWLTWLARREIRRETRGLAVAQSVEAPS